MISIISVRPRIGRLRSILKNTVKLFREVVADHGLLHQFLLCPSLFKPSGRYDAVQCTICIEPRRTAARIPRLFNLKTLYRFSIIKLSSS
jgi:hypothetical protein